MQRFSEEPLSIHEGCGGALERLVSPPALQFRGTGWYITDYARKADGKADSKPAGNGESKSGASSGSCCGAKPGGGENQ